MSTKDIKPKTVAVVKRAWHSPEIHAFIDNQEVGARMDIVDFVRALVEEMYGDKNRMMMLTKAEALSKALLASDSITEAMKQTTAHVV